jgi:ABC-2 type transport system ATP-binding protein
MTLGAGQGPTPVSDVPALRTAGLGKTYGDVAALSDLDVEVAPGEVFGYLGPNGSGKTTTIRLVMGLAKPDTGSAHVVGLDAQHDVVAAHRRIGYVPGEASLWPGLTGEETLHLLGRVHGVVDDAYRDELVRRFDVDLDKKVRAYSKGNRQKLLLVAGLMGRADLLVLDEPTSGLDPWMEEVFRACIREARDRGQAVFLSSHILGEVEALCDRVGILRAGHLVEVGTMTELRHLSEVTVEGPPPDLSAVAGVVDLQASDHHITCRVRGSMEPLLAAFAASPPKRLTSREPSLEELFLAHYG